jgi:hypothetical protein
MEVLKNQCSIEFCLVLESCGCLVLGLVLESCGCLVLLLESCGCLVLLSSRTFVRRTFVSYFCLVLSDSGSIPAPLYTVWIDGIHINLKVCSVELKLGQN